MGHSDRGLGFCRRFGGGGWGDRGPRPSPRYQGTHRMKLALTILCLLNIFIAWGYRNQARMNALALRLYAMAELPDGIYEECNCNLHGGCTRCWDTGYRPHACQ